MTVRIEQYTEQYRDAVRDLVRKSDLVADDALLAMARRLGHDPVLPPAQSARDARDFLLGTL